MTSLRASVRDLSVIARMLLAGGLWDGFRILDEATVRAGDAGYSQCDLCRYRHAHPRVAVSPRRDQRLASSRRPRRFASSQRMLKAS